VNASWDDLIPGRRIVLARCVERFPHFEVEPGATGTIEEAIEGELLRVRMHEPIAGCSEWENCIDWYPENIEDVLLDVALAPDDEPGEGDVEEIDVSEGTDSELEMLLANRDTDSATAAACTKELKARRDADYSDRDVNWWLEMLGAYEGEPGIAYR
jgi:hypothetical protein